MPKLMNAPDTVVQQTISNFGFSAKRPEDLTGSEYTIVDLEVDVSSSVAGFVSDLRKALETVVDSLNKSPYADRILLRVGTFGSDTQEIHGFIPLADIDKSSYTLNVGGSTALYDASGIGREAIAKYATDLFNMEYRVNGLSIVVTDGEENASRSVRSAGKLKDMLTTIGKQEHLESLKTILIGIGAGSQYLTDFQNDAGFDQYVDVGSATANSLAKMAGFISRSVSSSSQSLGSGGPSKNLSF